MQLAKTALLWIVPVLMPASATGDGGPALHVDRFATLAFRESPYSDFAGVVPLTEAEAASRNHYRFAYDERGRPVEISFRLDERLRPINHTANHFFRSPMIRISYGQGTEIRRFYDQHEHPITVSGDVFEERFTVDGRGRRRSLRFYDVRGEPVENAWGIASYHWRPEPDGSVVEHRKSLSNEIVSMRPHLDFRVLRLRYDARGQISLMQNLARDGGLLENATGVAQDRLSFDGLGRFLGWEVLDAADRPQRGNHPDVARGLVTPNRWGYEESIRFEDGTGRPIRNAFGWGGSRTTYDDFGNWTSRAFLDENGAPLVVEELGYHRYVFEWDRSGLALRSLRYLDTGGHPVPHRLRGYSEVAFEYDARGNRTALRYLDAEGQPVARLDTGVAAIERRFDRHDLLVEERFLGVSGELVIDSRRGYAVARYRYDDRHAPIAEERFGPQLAPLDPPRP